jgi:hypothetical protein
MERVAGALGPRPSGEVRVLHQDAALAKRVRNASLIRKERLLTDTELRDDIAVAVRVVLLQVIQQAAAL